MMQLERVVVALAFVLHHSIHAQVEVDFTTYVALGDGATAGFQNGALHETSQRKTYPTYVASAAGTPIVLPLIAEPGVPPPNDGGVGLRIQRAGECERGPTDTASGVSRGRIDPSARATNLAVPLASMGGAIESRWRMTDPKEPDPFFLEDFVLGYPYVTTGALPPSSQLEIAIALEPTFVTVWLGNMDAHIAMFAGSVDETTVTPVERFEAQADTLFAALAKTGARGAVLNVVNATSTAVLVSQPELEQRTGLGAEQLEERLGIAPGSYVWGQWLRAVDAIASGSAPGPLDQAQVLTKDEIDRLQATIDGYNRKLAQEARDLGWAHVDLNALFADGARGVEIEGVGRVTTKYLGGLWDLPGIQPSDTGQALIATAVISAINETYSTSLPLPDVAAIATQDPLACGVER